MKQSYWVPQNTGWSGGISWFDTYSKYHIRCDTREEAEEFNAKLKQQLLDPSVRFRVKYVEIKETYYE